MKFLTCNSTFWPFLFLLCGAVVDLQTHLEYWRAKLYAEGEWVDSGIFPLCSDFCLLRHCVPSKQDFCSFIESIATSEFKHMLHHIIKEMFHKRFPIQ